MAIQGTIFDIQRFSIHDGSGIRTAVFLKGCNLRCFWCHNPESLLPLPQIQFFSHKCSMCGACINVCPSGAHTLENNSRTFDREKCILCGNCVSVCYSGALAKSGRLMSVEEVMEEVLKDSPFYDESGGGITLTGGEPLLQAEFSEALLADCKKKNVHTAIESALNVPWSVVDSIRKYTDLFLVDIKTADSERHRQFTGVSNSRILHNLKLLADNGSKIRIRIPVIPGVNDSEKSMTDITDIIAKLNAVELIELLPFHSMALSKYESLGMQYKAKDLQIPSSSTLELLCKIFKNKNMNVRISGIHS